MDKEAKSQSSSSSFLKTDRGKTKSNAIETPSISLPKGGGAIKGIDEKFSVNAVNGTASFSIPLPVSQARGVTPALNLSYNSGSGNSVFGLGWSLGLSSIKRKIDKELPKYFDAVDSDIFLFSEAEDLVPEYKKETDGSFIKDDEDNYVIYEKDSPDGFYTIRFYKPRIEGLFARIERWIEKINGEIKWRVITKENITTLFGWSNQSRLTNPQDNKKVFEWFPEFVFDDKGNCAHYIYKREDDKGFDTSLLHNHNRFIDANITYTNLYLSKILYGNKTPYKEFGDLLPIEADYMFQTVLDYGEYEVDTPCEQSSVWDFRKDAFSDYRSGFEIRTTRLCKRVLLYHFFDELPNGSSFVKSLNFEYDIEVEESFTFLKSTTSFGYIMHLDGSYTHKNLPPMEFTYQKHEWNSEVKSVVSEDLVHAPAGLDEPQYQFTDLFNEGLSGILTEQAKGWYYKHNLGNGKFEQAKPVSPKPSFVGLGSQLQLADLDADGGKQITNFNSEPKGFFELSDEEEWQPFKTFESLPNIDFNDPNTRMLDLNGDGKPDILISEDNVFVWYESLGKKGYSGANRISHSFDEEEGPHIIFADSTQSIFLADMSGDGLTDIVRIRNAEICYWPNIGYGKFGDKISMDNAPLFDYLDVFNPAYLRIADIDGSGTPDIIYLGKDRFTCWMNLSGNSFSKKPFEISSFPKIDNQVNITVTDLLGNGVACIVWSSPWEKDAYSPLRYIDLMKSKKPHIMTGYKNNLGKEVSLEYTPSTEFYIEDKLTGKPWITKLHFPVHCLSRTLTEDKISGYRFVSEYKYHHGYYDHAEREFRGFGMVEQIDTETFEHWEKGSASNIVEEALHQEPVVSRTWNHTGAFLQKDKILNQFADDYWYEEMARQGFVLNHHEAALPDARLISAEGIDSDIIDNLSVQEWREALRACKGMGLRSETFAKDAVRSGNTEEARKRELTPFSVDTHNCVIELLQPKGKNRHAVFIVKESEAINYSYERDTEDPRIAHSFNIKLDEYANVLESASVVYPRLLPDALLPLETRQDQGRTVIIYTQDQFTNDVISDDVYRLRLPSEVKTFELKGLAKTDTFYSLNDFEEVLSESNSNTAEYHEIDKSIVADKPQKRLIEHVRSTYLSDNLAEALPLHQLESLGFPFESYQLAYTPELMMDVFGTKANNVLMLEGKFSHSEGDNNWWIRSGIMQFIEGAETAIDSQKRFYLPVSYIDPYGAKTKVKYYGDYFLFAEETEDALGNKASVECFNFRTLSPQRMKDPNNNISETITDELGLVKAMAVFGKGDEADDLNGLAQYSSLEEKALINDFFNASASDNLSRQAKALLQHATARFVYDFDTYRTLGKPVVVASIIREDHFSKNSDSPIQLSLEYSNGLGQVVMKKGQAEPGLAKQMTVNPDDTYTVSEIDTSALDPKQLRWIGNGRTILNNKGNAVKQYEPYFSVSHKYEDLKELVETGVTPIMYYDAMGRLIKTEMPDGTFSKIEFDSWQQSVYDENDTILDSSWYHDRTNHLIDAQLVEAGKNPSREKLAADKATKHANTPSIQHFDTLGRPILSIEHNKNKNTEADEFYHTRVDLDAEGNLRSVIDDRGNVVMQYKYDMLGNQVYQNSMDAGQRWLLINILGNPLRTWDERNHEFQYFYDILHRPTQNKVVGGDGDMQLDHIYERIFYGEGESDSKLRNIRGQVVRYYDTGGLIETPEYDFKSQPLSTTRKLFKNYKTVANWIDVNLDLDLENDSYIFSAQTDALGRITQQIAPDSSIIIPSYNEAGLLNAETVTHPDPALTTTYIKDIDYNEKGQRNKIIYGNGVVSRFYYDEETFRLKRLETKRQNSNPLQDWHYTYDPVGNITHIEDKNIPVTFFNNQKSEGVSTYTYDALYRLIEATGRENNAALSFGAKDNSNDAPYMHQVNPGDPMAIRNYTQSYRYDSVGNILRMQHLAGGNNWTRDYEYENSNNRLKSTQVGQGADAFNYQYTYDDKHGFIKSMPHLQEMGWNFKEELIKTIRQRRTDGGTPETTYYQYDGQGQRIRKITENQAAVGEEASKKEERIYIEGYELYKKHSGSHAGLERISLSLMDEEHRFVMIETRNDVDDGTEKHLVRYQLHNHLGSASLELDGTNAAKVISYEEYHPYGTTAYQASNATIKSAAKRYRYTGMERDEESGFSYHSARYYLPWLGRWLSTDPIGIRDNHNLYCFVHNSPIIIKDTNGKQAEPASFRASRTNLNIDYDLRLAIIDNDFFIPSFIPEFGYKSGEISNLSTSFPSSDQGMSNAHRITFGMPLEKSAKGSARLNVSLALEIFTPKSTGVDKSRGEHGTYISPKESFSSILSLEAQGVGERKLPYGFKLRGASEFQAGIDSPKYIGEPIQNRWHKLIGKPEWEHTLGSGKETKLYLEVGGSAFLERKFLINSNVLSLQVGTGFQVGTHTLSISGFIAISNEIALANNFSISMRSFMSFEHIASKIYSTDKNEFQKGTRSFSTQEISLNYKTENKGTFGLSIGVTRDFQTINSSMNNFRMTSGITWVP